MPNILGKAFAGLAKAYFQAVISEQLGVIKANNSKELYEKLLKNLHSDFELLNMAVKNKTIASASQIFTEPIELAAEEDNIQL